MSADAGKTKEQSKAEAEVESFRQELGPFVVAAETTRMPMIFTDAKVDGNPIIFANNSFLLLFGYGREEVLGQGFNFLVAHNTSPLALLDIAAAFEGTSNDDLETWYRRKDGSEVWASLLVSPVHDESGALVHRFISFTDLTKHKQAATELQAKLQAKSAFLEATLENMDQGIIVMNAESRVKLFNQRALALLDLPPELLEYSPLAAEVRQFQARRGDFAHQDNAALNLMQSGNFHSEPSIYERTQTNGNVLEVRTVPLPDGGAVRTYADITARRRAEEELRASEERYRALVTTTASIMWRAAPDGSLFDVAGFDQHRSLQHDLLGSGWLSLVHPDDRERVSQKWQAIVASGQPGELEFRFGHAPGEFRWMCSRSAPLKDADGAVREWVGTLSDIHKHKIAQEELARSESRYRLLAENVSDLIVRLDPSGRRLYVSAAAREMLGYELEELISPNLTEHVHPDDRQLVTAAFGDLVSGRVEQQTITYRHKHKEGRWIQVESRRRLIRDQEGRPVEVVSVIRDITRRVQLEEQLRQSQKMDAIGQLSGGIAHDFNNLLTVIIGNAEMLAENETTLPEMRGLSQMILEAGERGADLTRYLLAFSRRQALKPVLARLDDVVQGITPLLQRTIGEHIELRTEFASGLPPTLIDRSLLESSILNLVVNARDAMPQGGTLTIRTGEKVAGGDDGLMKPGQHAVFVAVSDTGTGMSPQVLEHVFEPFFTTKEVGKGSGLGLAMVYGFAQASAGKISIASQPGQGTTVTILLPAIIADEIGAEEKSSAAQAPRGREKVLLVEDDALVLQFVSNQLLSLGYEVTAVANGPDAIAALKEGHLFDILLTDLVLPRGMSGIDVARAAAGIQPDLKVLFTTGHSEDVFRNHGYEEGDIPLLRKPYRRIALAQALRAILS